MIKILSASSSQSSNPTSSSDIYQFQNQIHTYPPEHIRGESILSPREQRSQIYPYLLHHRNIMSNNLARRTPRSDNNEQKRRKEATIELTSDQSREFAEEEVVWAKVVGHPWWPAVISEKSYPTYHLDRAGTQLKRKEVTYRVSFFGESSHAFLEESKIAEYIPNRDYFVELALKQSKRCNIDAFRASVKQADITSNNPFEVGEVPAALVTPKKERTLLKDEKTAAYREESEAVEEKQNSTLKAIKTNNNAQKLISLPFQPTKSQKKVSQYALRLLKDKNKSKYTMKTLKCAVLHALKREKYLKKLNQVQSQLTLQWLRKISFMDIDEFVHANCKKSEITHQASAPCIPPEEKRTPKKTPIPLGSFSYIYLDELGNKMTSSVPLEPFDFYIEL